MPTKTKAVAPEPVLEEPIETQNPEEGLEEFGDLMAEGTEPDGQFHHEPAEAATEPTEPVTRLTGAELLAFHGEQKAAGRLHTEIAFDAGYRTITKTGQERVMIAQFNKALLEAQGIETGGGPTGSGRSHAGETKARVSGQGILLVSQLATRKIGAQVGEVFDVSYPEDGGILLMPTGVVEPVRPRKGGPAEEPGTPLLGEAQAA
jgi:hypothetical protein